jgi:hypothetical protein
MSPNLSSPGASAFADSVPRRGMPPNFRALSFVPTGRLIKTRHEVPGGCAARIASQRDASCGEKPDSSARRTSRAGGSLCLAGGFGGFLADRREQHEASLQDATVLLAQTRDCVPGYYEPSRWDEEGWITGAYWEHGIHRSAEFLTRHGGGRPAFVPDTVVVTIPGACRSGERQPTVMPPRKAALQSSSNR